MKKILFLLLVGIVAYPANASVLDKVHLTGEVQTIAASTDHSSNMFTIWGTDASYYRGTKTRAMAGFSADIYENVQANILFQYVYNWGDRNYTNNGFSTGTGMRLANANLAFSNLFDSLDVTIGRQFYGDEDSALIYFGPTHYKAEDHMYAKTLDGAVLAYHPSDALRITLMGGKIGNAQEIYSPSYSHYVTNATTFGADLKWWMRDNLMLQTYIYDFQGSYMIIFPYKREYKHHGFYGAKLKWTPDSYRFSVEYARNLAGDELLKEHHQGTYESTYMLKADAAADLGKDWTVRGTFLYSKDFTYAYGNYTPGLLMENYFIRNLWVMSNVFNYSDLNSVGGTRLFNVGVDFRPTDKWEVSLDGYSFQNRVASRQASLEADLTAKYNYSDNVQLFAGVGYIKNGTDVGTHFFGSYKKFYGPDNTKVQVGTIVRF